MPKHLLYVANIHVSLQQTGCKRMAEHMRRDMLLDGGRLAVFVNHPADALVGERFAGLVGEEMSAERSSYRYRSC